MIYVKRKHKKQREIDQEGLTVNIEDLLCANPVLDPFLPSQSCLSEELQQLDPNSAIFV